MLDFFLIPLGSSDVILGYQWLASLGESHMNWGAMTMKFKVGETRVQLQGYPSLLPLYDAYDLARGERNSSGF